MDASWGWILAGMAAVSSVFYAARNAMQSFWRSVESLLIVRLETYQLNVSGWVVYRWLRKNGVLLHKQGPGYATERVRVSNQFLLKHTWTERARNGDQHVKALFDAIPMPSVWLVHGWKLVVVTVDNRGPSIHSNSANKSGVNAYSDVMVTTVRGCFNLTELAKEFLQLEEQWSYESQKNSRFSVNYLTGSAAEMRRQAVYHDPKADADAPSDSKSAKPFPGADREVREGAGGVTAFEEMGVTPHNMEANDLVRGLPYGSRLEDLALFPEAMAMFKELKHWKNGRMWFAERGVPWKRGYGLIGPPGNGKTSMIRAMAAELGLPIFLVDLTSFSNSELASTWRQTVREYAPCMIVLEDLDRVFTGDKPQPGMYLSYDCLLNILDGMEQADGVCVFVTSNKPEQLDEAIMKKMQDGRIVTRPGRIDSVVEFNNPTMKGKLKIAKRILRGMDDETLEQLVEDGEQDTGAEFQQRCFKVAETFFWAHYEEPADAERDGGEVGISGV